ncbi:hypothetical protein D9757_006173 [Collybiopsis confluens]|uniref:Uncharacterized protein n=1 Tax=Collybiopsis confluens TaxID=2823264 RepID=A0A8H5HHP0_9AGAR|nr:hypothetical protein D9757_006173 [Collybiopsis confluens]
MAQTNFYEMQQQQPHNYTIHSPNESELDYNVYRQVQYANTNSEPAPPIHERSLYVPREAPFIPRPSQQSHTAQSDILSFQEPPVLSWPMGGFVPFIDTKVASNNSLSSADILTPDLMLTASSGEAWMKHRMFLRCSSEQQWIHRIMLQNQSNTTTTLMVLSDPLVVPLPRHQISAPIQIPGDDSPATYLAARADLPASTHSRYTWKLINPNPKTFFPARTAATNGFLVNMTVYDMKWQSTVKSVNSLARSAEGSFRPPKHWAITNVLCSEPVGFTTKSLRFYGDLGSSRGFSSLNCNVSRKQNTQKLHGCENGITNGALISDGKISRVANE